MKIYRALLAGAFALALAGPALSAGFLTNGLPVAGGTQFPTTLPLTGNETIPADTNLTQGLNPASEAITTTALAGFVGGSLGTWRNALIGGDFGTNLWQRGTTSASITTSALYTADRWWGLSGTGTAFTVIKQTGAADILVPYAASARVQRTAAQTGVIPVCFGQAVTSENSTSFQSKVVEFQFRAKSGANFSAANGTVTATIAFGTGSNQSAATFAAGTWTGQTNVAAQNVNVTSSFARYSVVGTVPATATQIGVKVCYTPVGTAGVNDWVEFAGMQLDANPAAVAFTGLTNSAGSGLAFEHRSLDLERSLQLAYYFEIDESAAITPIADCGNSTTSLALCLLQFPTQMRAIPVFTGDGGFTTGFAATTTTAMSALSACTSLAVSSTVASTAANANNVMLACGSSAAFGAAGTTNFLYSNNASGKIKASAEL